MTLGISKVKSGYARNHLIPKSLAKYATAENLKEFEEQKAELEKSAKENLKIANERKEKLDGFELKLSVEANEEGMLFGSIGPYEDEKHLIENGKDFQKRNKNA